MQKITVNDIRSIPPGETRTFQFDTPEALRNAQALTLYCRRVKKPGHIETYTTSTSWKKLTIDITAIPHKS